MNTFEALEAIGQAERTLRAADKCANEIAYLLKGRLRHVMSSSTLEALKKELRDYNIHTGKWKQP